MADETPQEFGQPTFPKREQAIPVQFLWPLSTRHLWVTVRWGFVGDRWVCVGISVDFAPGQSPRALTRADMAHVIRMNELLDYASAEFERMYRTLHKQFVESQVPSLAQSPRLRAEAFPKPHVSARLQEVAEVYNEARGRGDNKPTKAVRDHFGYGKNAASQVVFRARKAGLIQPVSHPGIMSGSPEQEEDTE